jgi:hypothetical protein
VQLPRLTPPLPPLAAWLALQTPLEQVVKEEEGEYRRAVAQGPAIQPGQEADLAMRVLLVHGDELVADTQADGGLAAACAKYKQWIRTNWPN